MKRFTFIINLFALAALFSCNGVEVEEKEDDEECDYFVGACFSVRDAEGHDLLDTLYAGHFDIESIVVNYTNTSRFFSDVSSTSYTVFKQRDEKYDSLKADPANLYERVPVLSPPSKYCDTYYIYCGYYISPAEETVSVDWPDGSSDAVFMQRVKNTSGTGPKFDYKYYLNGVEIADTGVIELVK